MHKPAHTEGRPDPVSNVRFGPFELDLRRGELRKRGLRIRLQEQPFQILRMLIESAGEVVSREEIRARLWPEDTVVEFEHSINAAVKRLRDALRESAGNPRYVKTIARRGYCFIGDLEVIGQPAFIAEPVEVARIDQPIGPDVTEVRPLWLKDLYLQRVVAGFVMILVLLVGVAVSAWFYRGAFRPSQKPLQPLMRLDLDVPSDGVLSPERGVDAVLSPDGTRLVYVSRSRLFTRMLDQSEGIELPGTEHAASPFFSPDGKWIAFFDGGNLRKIPVQGGPVTIIHSAFTDGGSWDDGGIVFGGFDFVISKVSTKGGASKPITKLAPGEVVHRWPQILPGGKAVLFTAYRSLTGLEGASVEVVSLSDGHRKTVVRGGSWARVLPSGYLIFINSGSLFAVRFDLKTLEVYGTPKPVLHSVRVSPVWGSAQIDVSRDGTLVYRAGKTDAGLVTIQWLDESGNHRPLVPFPGNYLSPTLSPDGKRLALISSGDIWVYDLQRAVMVRLSFGGGCGNPIWTADGRHVLFRAADGIFWTGADAATEPRPLLHGSSSLFPWSLTADGKRLFYVQINATTGADIWTVKLDSTGGGLHAGAAEVFQQTHFDERSPMISPDGRWMAYASNASGTLQVYVENFPAKRAAVQISTGGGAYPAWSPAAHKLFFWNTRTDQVMVAEYSAHGESFVAHTPRAWSQAHLSVFGTTRTYDPAPDAKRIVALMPAENPAPFQNQLIFFLNFFDELRRQLP